MPIYATGALAALVIVMATASILRVRQQCLGCRDDVDLAPDLA